MEDFQSNKKKTFCIIGAGGLGRELESWLSIDDTFSKDFELLGFLDTNLKSLEGFGNKYAILGSGTCDDFIDYKNILIGIANARIKYRIYEDLRSLNLVPMSFVHSSVIVGNNTQIDEGAVICPNAIVSCNVKIGRCFTLNIGSQIGHDCVISDFVSIMANVDLGGGVNIGDNVFIGSNSVILPGVSIPDDVIIGAGSVVVKTIKLPGTYFGNPAKRIF